MWTRKCWFADSGPPDTLLQSLSDADAYRELRGAHALSVDDLCRAFRQRSQQAFGGLATRVEPRRTFDDLIVADGLNKQLEEVLAAVRFREEMLARGFARKIAYGTGVSALFHGDSGTGKTLVAEVLAGALGVDMIKIDLATVVNKYIGETEKHLARIFDIAEADSGLLFFDEADALFGKRSETRDSHDRYANIEISYLLQRLESYTGLVILATNNRSHLDEAFTRRLSFIIRFPFPDLTLRERMWRGIWPAEIRVAEDVDFAPRWRAGLKSPALTFVTLHCWHAGWLPTINRHVWNSSISNVRCNVNLPRWGVSSDPALSTGELLCQILLILMQLCLQLLLIPR